MAVTLRAVLRALEVRGNDACEWELVQKGEGGFEGGGGLNDGKAGVRVGWCGLVWDAGVTELVGVMYECVDGNV